MNESEQAQAIAEIKYRHKDTQEGIESGLMRIGMPTAICAHNDRANLLEIVDSQAQKIAELSALFQKAGNGAVDLAMKCSEQEMTIAKLTAENEKLKTNYSAVIATNRQRG